MPQGEEEWLKAVTCPRCGDLCEPTGKSFRFGIFDGRIYLCEDCSMHFNAFYRDGAFSHTVPKAQVKLREIVKRDIEEPSNGAEPTDATPLDHGGEAYNITCPRCGGLAQPTGRAFKFGVFDGRSFHCEQCEKHFNAFYRDAFLSHTVPVGGVEIMDESAEEPEAARKPAETPPVQQEPEPKSRDAGEHSELETSEDQIDGKELGPDVQVEEQEASNAFVEQAVPISPAEVGMEVAPTYTHDEVVGFMRGLRNDVERMKELSRDEGKVVGEFFRALTGATSPLSLTLPVEASLLPLEMEDIERASVSPNGVLVLLMGDGTMETMNLTEPENRDLFVTVMRDALPHYKTLLQLHRQKIEQRIAFLSKATTDLREIADYIDSKEL
jgi:transposase-like protein